jgi:hypothetical protein
MLEREKRISAPASPARRAAAGGRFPEIGEVKTTVSLRYPQWEKSYQEALLEPDKDKLRDKVHVAEWRMFQRLQQLASSDDHHGERIAIEDALSSLRRIERNILDYPDWETL